MAWNQADLERIQELYGNAAEIISDGEDTLKIKVNEDLIAVPRFVEGVMEIAGKVVLISISTLFTVVIENDTDLNMVKAAAEKNGLQLVPIEGETESYKITLKDKDGR